MQGWLASSLQLAAADGLQRSCSRICNSYSSSLPAAFGQLLQTRQASSATAVDLKQVLEEEPLGAWRHDAWFRLPAETGAVGAYKIFRRRLEAFGPQREFHLLAMLRRIQTPGHAALGLSAVQLLRRHRSHHQQHSAFSHYIGNCLLIKAIKVGAFDVVVDALRRNHELGLGKLSVTRYATYLQQLARAGELKAMLDVYATMPGNGVRPTSEVMYIVTKACKAAGRADLAHAYAREFQANGLYIRPGLAALLELDSSQVQADAATASL